MATLLWPGSEFRISHQEMIKGMRRGGTGTAMSYLDTLVIPIIENTPDEEDLREGLEEVRRFPRPLGRGLGLWGRGLAPCQTRRAALGTLSGGLTVCSPSQAMRKYPDAVRSSRSLTCSASRR